MAVPGGTTWRRTAGRLSRRRWPHQSSRGDRIGWARLLLRRQLWGRERAHAYDAATISGRRCRRCRSPAMPWAPTGRTVASTSSVCGPHRSISPPGVDRAWHTADHTILAERGHRRGGPGRGGGRLQGRTASLASSRAPRSMTRRRTAGRQGSCRRRASPRWASRQHAAARSSRSAAPPPSVCSTSSRPITR